MRNFMRDNGRRIAWIVFAMLIATGATLAEWPYHAYDMLFQPPQPTAPSTAQILKMETTQPSKTLQGLKPSFVPVDVINGVGATGSVEILVQCAVNTACGNAYYEQTSSAPGFIVSGAKVLYVFELDTSRPLDKSDPQLIWVALPSRWQNVTKLSARQMDYLLKVINVAASALHKAPMTTNASQIVNISQLGLVTAGNTDQNYLINQIGNQ